MRSKSDTILVETQKIALIIEPDLELAEAISKVLVSCDIWPVVIRSLSGVNKKIRIMKAHNTPPHLVVMCPIQAGPASSEVTFATASISITDQIRLAFPKVKIVYTSGPTNKLNPHEYWLKADYLNLKKEERPSQYQTTNLRSNLQINAERNRKLEVERIVRQRSIQRAEQAKMEKEFSKRVINAQMPADRRLMFDELFFEMFEMGHKISRKRHWSNIKYRASLYKYTIDLGYVRYMWKKQKHGISDVF